MNFICDRAMAEEYARGDAVDARAMLAVYVARERIHRYGWCQSQNGAASKPRELMADIGATRRSVEAQNGEPLL